MHESVTVDRVLRTSASAARTRRSSVDEFGGTSGLITLEDVLSELLGDVGDEFKAGEPVAEMLPDGRVRLPGQMPVEDAATFLGTDVGDGGRHGQRLRDRSAWASADAARARRHR